MILRIWHGWTTHENADSYQEMVQSEVFDVIEKKKIAGYKGYQLLRKVRENETEFITMIRFEKLENVRDFVGEDFEAAHVPEVCRKLLKRYEERVAHFEVASSRDIPT